MPVSVVVGGQFGSEGKGKVALEIVRRDSSSVAVVRVGGTNSGHTAIDKNGHTHVLRQLPASAIDRNVQVVLPPGAYIDPQIFHREVAQLQLDRASVAVSPMARVITSEHKLWEEQSGLGSSIGSTQSGTGSSVLASVARGASGVALRGVLADDVQELKPYLADTTALLRGHLDNERRVVVEGTQGFGLSVLHGGHWPKATSRDTSAAAFLAECGLSPLDVDDVTMVIRCHPIRVAGDSGPLSNEATWQEIAAAGGMPVGHREFTTVTGKERRIAYFDPGIVKRAIGVNRPSRIVLNHLDYIEWAARLGDASSRVRDFVRRVEREIEQRIDWLGLGPDKTVERDFVMNAIGC